MAHAWHNVMPVGAAGTLRFSRNVVSASADARKGHAAGVRGRGRKPTMLEPWFGSGALANLKLTGGSVNGDGTPEDGTPRNRVWAGIAEISKRYRNDGRFDIQT